MIGSPLPCSITSRRRSLRYAMNGAPLSPVRVTLLCQSPTRNSQPSLEAGHIHGTNREVNPWTPGTLLTIVPTPDEETTIETAIFGLVASFNGARDYYDAHVAHEVISHDHA